MATTAATTTTASTKARQQQQPLDLIIRVALVDGDLNELNPSVWRRFKVSAHLNLDLLHDKVLAPLMGWTRNYHTYLMRKIGGSEQNNVVYLQQDTNAADLMHADLRIGLGETTSNPETVTIGTLLEQENDRVLYMYDLGDAWRHVLTLEEKIMYDDADGRIRVLDGAMRCPDEDGEGCHEYQTKILDLLNQVTADPHNASKARKLADVCFERHNALNVRGPFRPLDFDIAERQDAIQEALRSRNWARNSVKMFTHVGEGTGLFAGIQGRLLKVARSGQQFVTHKVEDTRGGDRPFMMCFGETVNTKPDEPDSCLCNGCGNPLGLKFCSACHCSRYCSAACQKKEWKAHHKKMCKREQTYIKRYAKELESGKPDPNRFVDGEVYYLQMYDPNNLRLKVGDFVECRVGPGEGDFATGHVVDTMYREDHWPASKKSAPYQIQLDRASARRVGAPCDPALIYAEFDDDHQIRPLPKKETKTRKKKTRWPEMQIVD